MPVEPTRLSDGNRDSPVVNVSWIDVGEFIDRLNRRAAAASACRPKPNGNTRAAPARRRRTRRVRSLSTDQANYNGDFPLPGQADGVNPRRLTTVGSFAPNAWGLHDMHGNAWEWTADAYCATPAMPSIRRRRATIRSR